MERPEVLVAEGSPSETARVATPAEKIATLKDILGIVPRFWSTELNLWVRFARGGESPVGNTLDVSLSDINTVHRLVSEGSKGAAIYRYLGVPGYEDPAPDTVTDAQADTMAQEDGYAPAPQAQGEQPPDEWPFSEDEDIPF